MDHPAVVGEKDDDRVLREAEGIDLGHQRADRVVEALDHRAIDRIPLRIRRVSFRPVLPDQFRLALHRGMNREAPVVEEERPFAILAHELGGFQGHPVFNMLPIPSLAGPESPRREIASAGTRPRRVGQIHVETVPKRIVRLAPQMPLPEMAGAIAGFLEGLGQGEVLMSEASDALREQRRLIGLGSGPQALFENFPFEMPARPRNANPGGMETGKDAGPSRGADRSGRIGIGEGHATVGQPIDIGRLVEFAAVERGVPPAQVIGQNEDHVRRSPARLRRRLAEHSQQGQCEDQNSHAMASSHPEDIS